MIFERLSLNHFGALVAQKKFAIWLIMQLFDCQMDELLYFVDDEDDLMKKEG